MTVAYESGAPRQATRSGLRYVLPPGADATEPPERRGVARDEVRLLVARPDELVHRRFRDLPAELEPGDLVVVNTSATLPAALTVWRTHEPTALMHVAGELDDGSWVVELRAPGNTGPAADVVVGERIGLAGDLWLRIVDSYPESGSTAARLWRAEPSRAVSRIEHLLDHGHPIAYGYVRGSWPLSDLQTVYADEPGSAEMPSAGRPFSGPVMIRLAARGVLVTPIVLHTGVSSPEKHEPPAPERFRVPATTARLVNQVRGAGGRVVAVGTTVVRALETVGRDDGFVTAGSGWTDLVLGPARPARVVTGLVTGLHEPEASHLDLLDAVAGSELVDLAYDVAVRQRYRWHEFGDSMLFLPARSGGHERRQATGCRENL